MANTFFYTGRTIINVYSYTSLAGLFLLITDAAPYFLVIHFVLTIAMIIFFFIWYWNYQTLQPEDDEYLRMDYRQIRTPFIIVLVIYGIIYTPLLLLTIAELSSNPTDDF